MSDVNPFGFGKFVPGFDFLQNLTKGAADSAPQMPNLSKWIAPTLNVEELEKRIQELKAVQFWLDQNATALKATIQALEVQKMTLNTLKGMNFNMSEVANAFKLNPAETVFGSQPKAEAGGSSVAASAEGDAAADRTRPRRKVEEKPSRPAAAQPPAPEPAPKAAAAPTAGAGVVDPMQWWGSLTQQFQQIASSAMKDAAKQPIVEAPMELAAGFAKGAMKSGMGLARAATGSAASSPKGSAAKKAAGSRKRGG